MAVNPNWPLTVTSVAFNADPFDSNATPSYTDLSNRVREFSASVGRQYELDVIQAGEASYTLRDEDEALNPTNPSSPYAGTVLPYRQIIDQSMWPPAPIGAAVNLLNATAGYDPSFETTATGGTPPNLLTFNVSPTVQAANPFTGTKSLQWSVAGSSAEQVAGFTINAIPGQQYLLSVYVRQTAANTTVLFLNGAATGTSTTTTGAYVRLSVGFVATRPSYQMFVGSFAPTLASTMNIDAVQLEPVTILNSNPYFEGGTVSPWTAQNGATIAASPSQHHEGSYSLKVTPDGVTATPLAISEEVAVSVGTVYTVSGWLWSTSSTTRRVGISWYDNTHTFLSNSLISVALSAGVWTQLGPSVFTAPASAAFARIVTSDPGTPAAANVWFLDQAILTTASAFSLTGPVIYGNFGGFVERWPSRWNYHGVLGEAQITAVDGFAILAGQFLSTEYRNAVLAKQPAYYWPLSEAQGATSFADISGNNGPALVRLDSPDAPGTVFQSGANINMPGDPNGTGLQIQGTGNQSHGSCLIGSGITVGNATQTWSMSISLWSAVDAGSYTQTGISVFGTMAILLNSNGGGSNNTSIADLQMGISLPGTITDLSFYLNTTPAQVMQDSYTPPGGVGTGFHHYVLVITLGGGNISRQFYVDGLQVVNRSATLVFEFGTSTPNMQATNIQVGGWVPPGYPNSSIQWGIHAHAAVWNRALSSDEVTDLYTAASTGYSGETSGARISRYLSYNWVGTTSIDAGQSTMGASDLADNTSVLDAVLGVTSTEGGLSYVDDTGTIVFQGRNKRFTNTTATWSFGENESPYEADIAYDYDPTLVVNDPQVTQSGGIQTVGGTLTARQASWKKYGKRSYSLTVNCANANEAQNRADWIFFTHQNPLQRISTLTLKPSGNTSLWPVCLGIKIGDRATVKRRTTAGYTMSGDYFVERIEQSRSPTEWIFSLQLSPAAATGQPWLLGDSTYGVLDTTTLLGF